MALRFIEGRSVYEQVPRWVCKMIWLGYWWREMDVCQTRRIGLISMPCESVGAPLIALGALRHQLEVSGGNIVDDYFGYMVRKISALKARGGEVFLLDKNDKRWKVSEVSDSRLISVIDNSYRPYIRRKGKTIINPHGACTSSVSRENATCWKLLNHPSPVTKKPLDSSIYNRLPGCDRPVVDENLRCSSEDLLLIGRGTGENTNYKQRIRDVLFAYGCDQQNLLDLLTIEGGDIRRIIHCTARCLSALDDNPKLVVADGAREFLRAIDHFKESDVIGVISRDGSTKVAGDVSAKLNDFVRYYRGVEYPDFIDCLPKSIAARFIKRR